MRVYLYILRWPDADVCEQGVPWAVDEHEIFFGSCKRPLRAELRSEFLGAEEVCDVSQHDLYLVGLNGVNPERRRNVIWFGKITKLMTFAHAWRTLTGPRYEEMRSDPASPLHLEPLYEENVLVGYRHASLMHEGEWIDDLTSRRSLDRFVTMTDNEVRLLRPDMRHEVFDRDACLLLERCFYATNTGLPISPALLDVLRDSGFLREDDTLDEYAVFGHRKDGSADGKTGRWLLLEDANAESLLRVLASALTTQSDSADIHQPAVIASSRTLCNRGCD